ncbi:unnamed protein product [Oikopleura dioica]|uniref:SAM domain-containing protein n=1 Tax=Oikopleura dioica TaxID=34765 RepID=E4WXS1_OIKDI|nr:unnamed protein product [Oikopleura dioica]CBY39329.1 unnamed protein product [Oikopleura dioica]
MPVSTFLIPSRDGIQEGAPNMPSAFYWTQKDVARWIEELGYPQYKIGSEINLSGRLSRDFLNQTSPV